MIHPITNWQRTYLVRTTVEQQSNNLAEALTRSNAEIRSALDSFTIAIEELKHLYDFESTDIERTVCNKALLGAEEN
jgi:hypothetical protein